MEKFPFIRQLDTMNCGASCLAMIAKYYGKQYSVQKLQNMCFTTREGVSLSAVSDAAEILGFHSRGVYLSFEQLAKEAPLPVLAHWRKNHFVIVYDVKLKKKTHWTVSYMWQILDRV